MINPVFFISEHILSFDGFIAGEENVHYSLPAITGKDGSLETVYRSIGESGLFPLALTLEINQPLPPDDIRLITACLFIPGYCRISQNPLINLSGNSAVLLEEAASLLKTYISEQGYTAPIINLISPDELSFHSAVELEAAYPALLNSENGWKRNIYIYPSDRQSFKDILTVLRSVEADFQQKAPLLYLLIQRYNLQEKELGILYVKQQATAAELDHHRQYVEVLRSGHAAKEIQEFYNREYEVLPMWYKRLGHILKVFTGKRTFRSLFRDDVKKYKD